MKRRRILLVLFVLASLSCMYITSVYARYTTRFSGAGTALTARWNFSVRGEDDPEGLFYTKGFTFDLFSSESVKPMDSGSKSFTFTGGGSDTAIKYDVKMNTSDLMLLAVGEVAGTDNVEIYAPFLFKIEVSINEGATDTAPAVFMPPQSFGDGWFRPRDIVTDVEGYFSIFGAEGLFGRSSTDQVTVTVYWQWNTSFYINDTGVVTGSAYAVTPNVLIFEKTENSQPYPPYYMVAYNEYYGPGGLEDRLTAASDAVTGYLAEHGTPSEDGTWQHSNACPLSESEHNARYSGLPENERGAYLQKHAGIEDGTGAIIWGAHGFPCTDNHFAIYDGLIGAAENALIACRTSLLKAYDGYDTLAADALFEKESVKVIFHITGEQIAPT